MSWLSLCHGEGCPLKEKCLRYLLPPGTRQGWVEEKFVDGNCENFLEKKENDFC